MTVNRRFLHSEQEVHVRPTFMVLFCRSCGRFSKSGSDDLNGTVALQVDAPSVPEDEKNPKSCGVY